MAPDLLPSIDVDAAASAPADTVLLDVREYEEWMSGHAPNAVHIAMSELADRIGELDRTRRTICICRSGNRSACHCLAARARLRRAQHDRRHVRMVQLRAPDGQSRRQPRRGDLSVSCALLASPLGLLIGISLGALGGGGSILAVPALVYAAGQSPKQATTTSLVLVALTALIGIALTGAGRVRFVAGTIFGLAGIGGSLLGSHWNKAADPDVLLLALSGLMLVAAYAMWRRASKATTPSPSAGNPSDDTHHDTPGTEPGAGDAAVTARHIDPGTIVKVVVAGTVVGLLTGFFGVGGGFVIVPALVLALGFTMAEAVGTSLLVITINSVVALSTRLQAGSIEWGTVIPFTIASMIGVVIGSRLASTRDSSSLQRWFVGLLVVVAVYTAVRSALALS